MFRFLAVLILLAVVQAQLVKKSGNCPPPTPLSICSASCYSDEHCVGVAKCCPTACGGAVCTKPVSDGPKHDLKVKIGSCPESGGPWVCSSTCSADGDCRGRLKCCKNRCGALTCTKPQL